MKEYQVDFVETLESTVTVIAENEDEAFKLAEKELSKDFCAPYHTYCGLQDYTITMLGDVDID